MIETLDSLIRDSGQAGMLETRDDVTINLSYENPRTSFDRIFELLQQGNSTWTGRAINENLAYNISAVYRGVGLISGSMAMMPLTPYRRSADGGKNPATDHYLYPLLAGSANPWTSAFRFRRLMTAWAVLRGNAVAIYDYHPNGRVYRLTPVHPDRVKFRVQDDGSLLYDVTDRAGSGCKTYTPNRILHIRGLEATDEGIGLSVLMIGRQTYGLSLATEEAGAKLFGNGMITQGYLSHPGRLDVKARENLQTEFNRRNTGLANAGKIPIFEEGMSFAKIGIDPVDAQFLETRKFSIIEISRWLGLPPHMLGELDKATYSNIEQQGIDFVTYSLGPWIGNWQSEIEHTLLSDQERKSVFVEFETDMLTRGDMVARFTAYGTAVQNGILMPNEVRAKENLNGAPGGDRLYANGNYVPLASAGIQYGQNGAPPPDPEADATITIPAPEVKQ